MISNPEYLPFLSGVDKSDQTSVQRTIIFEMKLCERRGRPGPGIEPGSGDPQSPRMPTTPPRPFTDGNYKDLNYYFVLYGAWILVFSSKITDGMTE